MFWTWRIGNGYPFPVSTNPRSRYLWLNSVLQRAEWSRFASSSVPSSSHMRLKLGDTIPHVVAAVFPSLRTSSFFSIFINRQVVIILCTALVSYPLSLYRDITKLAKASALALVSMVIIVFTVVSEGPNVPEEYRGTKVRLIPSGFGIFQAIGVISFGNPPFPPPPSSREKGIDSSLCVSS